MKYFIWFVVLFCLLLIQGGIFTPLHIMANLILIVVALAALLSDFNVGLIITLMGGIMLDFTSGSTDGLVSISLLTAFLLMYSLVNEILPRETSLQVLVAAVGGSTIVFFILFLILSRNPDIRYILIHRLWIQLFWNLIWTYPVYYLYLFIQNVEPFRNRSSN